MFHYIDHIRSVWSFLLRNDKKAMQELDYATVKALELKAPGAATSDAVSLFHQLKSGEIFGAFSMDYRMKIWARLQATDGLVPTLWTFFEHFKYMKALASCMKYLVTVPFKATLYKAMEDCFSETAQERGKCIVQEAESVFSLRPCDPRNRVAIYYRQLFLLIMRNHRELLPGSTRMEPKQKERMVRTTKDPDKSVLYELADLAERLGFKSSKITDLKAKYSSQAKAPSQSKQLKPTSVVDGLGECLERRSGCPFDLSYEQSKELFYIDNMHSTDKSQGSSITAFEARRSTYLAYFGRLELGKPDSTALIYPTEEPHQAPSSTEEPYRASSREEEPNRSPNPASSSLLPTYLKQAIKDGDREDISNDQKSRFQHGGDSRKQGQRNCDERQEDSSCGEKESGKEEIKGLVD
jgi:hypothetical protein